MRSATVVLVALALAGCSGSNQPGVIPADAASESPTPAAKAAAPTLKVETVTNDLEFPWDVGFLPSGQAVVTERGGRLSLLSSTEPGAKRTTIEHDLSVAAGGEGGLLGLVVGEPGANGSPTVTVCFNSGTSSPTDVRLVTLGLDLQARKATSLRTLLDGLPTAASGRHSGCRPTIAADGALLVGTGDTASGPVPQDLTSLGGKLLRMDAETGKPLPDNPFAKAASRNEKYVYSYGHRNIQGVAVQPGTGNIYTAEHGPNVDDEVNLVTAGSNAGWDPSKQGESTFYDESVPMTDLKAFPDASPAVWSTGDPTQALAGATFLTGSTWGAWEDTLAVAALKGSKLLIFTLKPDGGVDTVAIPDELNGTHGRLRAARVGPDGALYVTTSNGSSDELLRITPS